MFFEQVPLNTSRNEFRLILHFQFLSTLTAILETVDLRVIEEKARQGQKKTPSKSRRQKFRFAFSHDFVGLFQMSLRSRILSEEEKSEPSFFTLILEQHTFHLRPLFSFFNECESSGVWNCGK